MKIFKIIKKMLKSAQPEVEQVPIEKFHSWYDEKLKRIFNRLSNEINLANTKIKNEILKAEKNIVMLRNARLKNPNITVREKQFMEGNRDAYIKKIEALFKNITIPNDINSLEKFFAKYNENIESFSKVTAKPYHILQEFFANESGKIACNIGNIDRTVKILKNRFEELNLDLLREIKEDFRLLKKNIESKREVFKNLKKKKKWLADINKSIKDFEKQIHDIENSNEFKDLVKLKEKKNKKIDELNNHRASMLHSFSVLERSLKKYSKISFEDTKLVEAYIANPILTLRKDSELKILKILDNMETSISNNTIDLRDKKKEKTIKEIKKMNKAYFEDFLSKFGKFKDEITAIEKKIMNSNIEEKLNKKKKTELKNSKDEKENIEQSIAKLQEELEKISIDRLKEQIRQKVNEAMDIKITIS